MIVNFGSLNIDYVYAMDHFIQPGETYTASRLQIHPGGKGLNQSVAVARAGGSVRHVGCIGREGLFLKTLLETEKVDTSGILSVNGSNGHAIIQVDRKGENCIILYSGANRSQPEGFAADQAARLDGREIVLFQNETDSTADMMRQAKTRGCRIALNPAPMDARVGVLPLPLVDYLIVNEGEGAALAGFMPEQDEKGFAELLEFLAARYVQARIILTLGAQGLMYAWRGQRLVLPAFEAGPVIDTTAAGDTLIGTYLAWIDEDRDDETALKMATRAAGLTVTRAGAASSIPYRREYTDS